MITSETPALAPTIEHFIEGRGILVFDGFLDEEVVEALALLMMKMPYQRKASFDNELWCLLPDEIYTQIPELPETLDRLASSRQSEICRRASVQQRSHQYCASLRYGDQTHAHQDVQCEDCVTFLLYTNIHWESAWGGETRFYDEHQDTRVAVCPRPGRLVMFSAALWHRTGVPDRDCPVSRQAMSIFYRCPAQLAGAHRPGTGPTAS